MFENILTKETVSFKDLEEIAYKIANEILKNMLEEYDKQHDRTIN